MWYRGRSWEGWVIFLDCLSPVQAVFSLKLCSLSEALPLLGVEVLILWTTSALWSH